MLYGTFVCSIPCKFVIFDHQTLTFISVLLGLHLKVRLYIGDKGSIYRKIVCNTVLCFSAFTRTMSSASRHDHLRNFQSFQKMRENTFHMYIYYFELLFWILCLYYLLIINLFYINIFAYILWGSKNNYLYVNNIWLVQICYEANYVHVWHHQHCWICAFLLSTA